MKIKLPEDLAGSPLLLLAAQPYHGCFAPPSSGFACSANVAVDGCQQTGFLGTGAEVVGSDGSAALGGAPP